MNENKRVLSIATILSLFLGTLGVIFGNTLSVSAVSKEAPETTNIIVHKLQYQDDAPVTIVNDGTELELPTGVEKYDPAKYGEVSFSLVDITDYSKTKSVDEIQEELNQLEQTNYQSWIASNGKLVAQQTVNADGVATFDDVPSKNTDSHIYAVLETKSPAGLVKKIAQPIIVSLPMTNKDGDGFLTEVNLYPKNQVQELTLTLTKYADELKEGQELSGVEFDLYSGKPGTGTKVNEVPLITNDKGQISVTGLTVGSYYLVETKAPEGYVIHANAQNNANNKLTFEITEAGIDSEALKIDFINFKKPTSEKTVENGTAPGTNNSSFELGDKVSYKNTIDVPKDIAGSQFVSINGETVTTQTYTVFNYTDIGGKGLTYTGDEESVVVTGEGGKTLMLGKDYTYEAQPNGFKIDFILADGKVSSSVAELAGKKIYIDYQMMINEEAKEVISSGNGIENSYDLTWNNNPKGEIDDQHITGKVPVYTGGAKFVKEDSKTQERLAGAKFVLINSNDEYFNGWITNELGLKEAQWIAEQPTAGEGILTSSEDGTFEIFGLAYGSYSLKEIQAPDGYALATKPFEFEITADTYTGEIIGIQNSKKSSLPMTGSIQLVTLTLVGILLLFIAGFYYKKRFQ